MQNEPKPEEASPKLKGEKTKRDTNWKNLLAPFVAVVLLVFYSLFLISLRGKISAEELEWTRWIYLLSGVEAIAFTAAGYLFGKEVHRSQAEAAERQTEEAQQNAVDANQRAAEAEKEAVGYVKTITEWHALLRNNNFFNITVHKIRARHFWYPSGFLITASNNG